MASNVGYNITFWPAMWAIVLHYGQQCGLYNIAFWPFYYVYYFGFWPRVAFLAINNKLAFWPFYEPPL